jgi:hypothetical protein
MPYIKQGKRKELNPLIEQLADEVTCEGDLNYIITSLVHFEISSKGKNYQNLNNLIGMLECTKLELYRMIVGPYEDIKIRENGDIDIL